MNRFVRLFYTIWPYRWLRSLLELLRAVRIHWSAELLAGRHQVLLGPHVVIGARTRLVVEGTGRISIEDGAWLSSDIEIQTDTWLVIGSGTTVQRRCSLLGNTRIGRGCLLAPNVFISSGKHPFRAFPHLHIREQERRLREASRAATGLDQPVWVQDDCWLGVNAVISPGVTIGKGSVVGANAVVTRDVPPYAVVAGAPARVISARLPWIPPSRIDIQREEDLVYILAGLVRVNDAGKTCVVVKAGEPLLAAVALGARAIAVRCRASCALEVEVAGKRIMVEEGSNALLVPTLGLSTAHSALMFELAIVPAVSALLEVSVLESVDCTQAAT